MKPVRRTKLDFRVDRKSIRRIFLIMLGSGAGIGDFLIATPMIRTLRKGFPNAHIAALAGKRNGDLLLNNADVDEVIVETSGLSRRMLNRAPFDLAINYGYGAYYEMLCLLSGARFRIGAYKQMSSFNIQVYNLFADGQPFCGDAIDFYLRLTKALGLPDASRKTAIYLTKEEKLFANEYIKQYRTGGCNLIGIHPGGNTGTGRPDYLWGEKNFAGLADRLIAWYGASVLIFSGPGEEAVARGVYKHMKQKKNAFIVPVLSLRRYASVVQKSSLFIAHNRGPMHIAAALGVKIVGIFFATNDAPFLFPYAKNDGAYLYRENLKDITVNDVFAAVKKVQLRLFVKQSTSQRNICNFV